MSRRQFEPMFGAVCPHSLIGNTVLAFLMVLVLVTDSLTQLGFAHGYLYIPIILFASAVVRMQTVVIVTCSALLFNWFGFFLSPDVQFDLSKWAILANRTLSFVMIVSTYLLLHHIKRAERAAAKSKHAVAQKNYFKELSDALPVMVWVGKPDGSIAYVGSQLVALTGETAEYIQGNWQSLVHPEDVDRAVQAWEKSVATGEPCVVEFRIKDHQNNYSWMLTQAKPKYNAEGEIEIWYGSCSDISRQQHEKEELRLLRTAVSRLNDIIIITEAEPVQEPGPRVVFVNEAFERKTGFTAEEILGKTPRILQGPGTQSAELDKIRTSLLKWQSVRAKILNYTKDGSEIWLELDIVPIADKTGWYTHWVAVERDVTREHNMEQQLQQVQRLESISHLTGSIAHDFNNLLTIIMGNADLLCENLADDAHRKLANTILHAAERGSALTNSLLSFARRQALDPEPVDIGNTLKELEPLLRTAIGRENKFNINVEPELPYIFIDCAQLENALLNLATNAKHAMSGHGELTIEAKVSQLNDKQLQLNPDLKHGSYMLLKVSDNGHGIPEKDLEHIFEPFFSRRSDNSGTGLGLSMVFGFVKQSGGHITVSSEVNKGTTFTLYLPLVDSAPAINTIDEAPTLSTPMHLTILVVDDETSIRRLAVDYLKSEGFKVLQAEHAAEALQLMEQHDNIDFLFSDIVMPGELSGIELAHLFASRYPKGSILLTSGFAEKIIDRETGNIAKYPILSKPYRKQQLINHITRMLRRED
ncbi:PAS domain S-box protein [Idiomarina seosinensis]|uniref:PAS domain-containing hybrid sensor histidine kinase/response regulator n=1 Tax=Idiomarina seosinensis TaxID=281739 RepID=UPI003850D76F